MWPFPKRLDPEDDRALRSAEYRVMQLQERADRVDHHLRKRMDRNHWSETVDQLWTGRA